jgi:hypothetical protein
MSMSRSDDLLKIIERIKISVNEGVYQAIHNHQLSNQKIVYLQDKKIRTLEYKVKISKTQEGLYTYLVISSDGEVVERGKKYSSRPQCIRAIRNSRRKVKNLRRKVLD